MIALETLAALLLPRCGSALLTLMPVTFIGTARYNDACNLSVWKKLRAE